jgi:hypothetical protein
MNELNDQSVAVVHQGLKGVAVSTSQIADYLRVHPGELQVVAESASGIQSQFSDLVEGMQKFAGSANELRTVTQETIKGSDWIGGKFSGGGVSVNNSFGRVVGSFEALS